MGAVASNETPGWANRPAARHVSLFHKDFLGMIWASEQFLFPAAHSRQAQGDKTCMSVVEQGTICVWWRRATGNRGRESREPSLPGVWGHLGICDLIR